MLNAEKRKIASLFFAVSMFAIPATTHADAVEEYSEPSALESIGSTISGWFSSFSSWLSGESGSSSGETYGESDGGGSDDGSSDPLSVQNATMMTVTLDDGRTVNVNSKAFAFKVAEKKKQESVSTLSHADLDEVASEVSQMHDPELDELEQAIENGGSYGDLSADEVAALNQAYNDITYEAINEGDKAEGPVTISNIADMLSSESPLSSDQRSYAAATGLLAIGGAGATAAAIGYCKRAQSRLSKRSSFSMMSPPPKKGVSDYKLLNVIPTGFSYADKQAASTIADFIAGVNGSWSGASLTNLSSLIVSKAKQWGVDPFLITCQLNQESGFSPDAGSPAGACGIAQFMPSTAAGLGVDVWDVESSIDGQCHYMSNLMSQFGDYSLALAGYNAGEGAVQEYGGIPPYSETQNYVSSISSMWGGLKAQYDQTAVA